MLKKQAFRVLFVGALAWGTSPGRLESAVVSTATELAAAIAAANSGGDKLILLNDGTYTLSEMLWVAADAVTVKSVSQNRNNVIIEGNGMGGYPTHIFNVAGSHFTVQDVTLRSVSEHAIQLQIDVDSVTIRNVHILDTGEQMIKVVYDSANLSLSSDDGIVEDSLLEYSAGIGPQYYIGGVDAHNAKNWIVRGNTFKGIRSPSLNVAEFAVHFWSDSENTLVERNLIINCDRGIGFGLGSRGHAGGIVRNNMIYHDSSEMFADVGIALESAPGAQVYNNTVYFDNTYPNAIEYRFASTTGVTITNNLTNKAVTQRDGASGTVSHNVTTAAGSWFVSPSSGDLHLSYAVPTVVDQGQTISGLIEDFDEDSRPRGSGIDIGADEYRTCAGVWDLLLSDDTIDTTILYEACRTITVGPYLVIDVPGDVTFRAGETVILTNGFVVRSGTKLTVEIDPSL